VARIGVRVLGALAPAVLLAVDPWGWYPFGPVKWLLVLVLGFGGAALVLHDTRPQVPRSLQVALGAFLGWLALAAALGDDRLYAWTGTPERHLGVLTWALCALLLAAGTTLRGRCTPLVTGLVVAGFGIGAVATAEALGWEPAILDVAGRLSGSVGSPAYLGAATALLLPVALGVAWSNGRSLVGAAASMTAVLLGVACLGSGARAAWVGLAAAAAVTITAGAGEVLAAARRRPGRTGVALLALGAVGILVLVVTPVGARLGEATDPDSAGGRGRLDEWRVAARVVADHPLVGVGPEGYRLAFHEGVDARYEREHGRRQQPDRAHSAPLDLALAGGLPLLALWLAVMACLARALWRALYEGAAWERGIAAGLVAHWVGQLLLFPIVELEPVAWLLAGLLVATTAHPTRSGPDPWTQGSTIPGQNPWRWVSSVVGGLAVVGLVAGATDVVADHRADRAVDALARGDARAAVAAADSAAALRPDIVRLHLLAARAAVADQQGALGGLRRVDDALAVSPHDPIALLERTSLLVQRAESTQTPAHVAAARAAVDDRLDQDPDAAALWRLSARLAVVEGDPSRADRDARHADRLTPPDERP
jgi:O-antigen ligase